MTATHAALERAYTTWTSLDVGNALREAEKACRGAYGPVLTRTTNGWEATATIVDGRRFRRRTMSSGVLPTPDAALLALADLMRAET